MNTTTQDQAAAGVAAATAIAKAATTAVGAPAPKFAVAFGDKAGVFDNATVEGLSLAAPRVRAEQGTLFLGKDDDLGAAAQFELVSFNHRWAIGTGEQDSEAKDFFRVSMDGVTISGEGGTCEAYIESLKAQGFTKAKKTPYMDLWGFVVWSEKKGDIPVDERELVCVQASQTSMGAFVAFATTRGLLESRGVAKPLEFIEIHAEKRTSGTNKYTNMSFHAPKAK